MKTRCRIITLVLVVGYSTFSFAQLPDLTEQTLSFQNVTSTNVIQTVPEIGSGTEKDIEFADYDNDGDLDVVVSTSRSDFGQRRNKLYRNDIGVLQEVSGSPVIPGFSFTDFATSAFFRDYDNDGFADIIIVCGSNSGAGTNDSPGKTKYFRNVGGVSFVNESERLDGITGAATNGASADFDGNGFCDLVMANEPNVSQDGYVRNNVDGNSAGEFVLVTSTDFPAESNYGDNAEAADMNGDGLIDLLIANSSGNNSFIYYNNNEGQGSGPGDFRYASRGNASSFSGVGGLDERVLFPGDFNNDGLMDFYFSTRLRQNEHKLDFVMQNIGNDEYNRAQFAAIGMPASTNSETMKVRSNDLDQDGRVDLLVMSEFRRPQIFRNTSENGEISFLEWTPAVFGIEHAGWLANSADLIGDERPDVLVGALNDDHLFLNTASESLSAVDLPNHDLPMFHDLAPISVTGEIEVGRKATFSANALPIGSIVSVLLRSLGDASLTVSQGSRILATSNRIGHGTDEAIQFVVPANGTVEFEVAIECLSFDGNDDGMVDLLDIQSFVDCLTGANAAACEPFDVNDNGEINLLLVQPFVDSVVSNRNSETFVLEFLSRSN